MAQRVFFLNKLRDGIEKAEYERWVREVDYPFARGLTAIDSYVVTRLDALLMGEGELPYDYLEVIEIAGIEEYQAALSGGPEVEEFFEEWSSYVGESVAVYGEVIE